MALEKLQCPVGQARLAYVSCEPPSDLGEEQAGGYDQVSGEGVVDPLPAWSVIDVSRQEAAHPDAGVHHVHAGLPPLFGDRFSRRHPVRPVSFDLFRQFVDIPPDHGMFRSLFHVKSVPQIPGISFWWGTGGQTSEQGADSAEVHVRGIFDDHGRLMVLSTHNTDVADGWEREGVSADYFHKFSVDSYAVGVNIAIYTLLH